MTEQLNRTWSTIVQDRNHHIVIKVVDNKIVSSCVCDKKCKTVCYYRKCCYSQVRKRNQLWSFIKVRGIIVPIKQPLYNG